LKPKSQSCDKRPYQKPVLRVYGTIQAITRGSTHKVAGDTSGNPNKT